MFLWWYIAAKKLKRILTKTGKLVKIMQDKMQTDVLNL